jgi:hypothetical protein
MAVDPYTMMMIAQGVGNMAQGGSRLLQPKFQNTRYGRLLRQTKREGNLSQGQENTILNKVGTTAGNQAQVSSNKYVGRMYNQGMGNSVALNRGLREAENDVRRTVTDTAKGIYSNEETAKRDAKFAYAQGVDQDKSERTNAWGSVGGAVAKSVGSYYNKKYTDQQSSDQNYKDAINKYGTENVSETFSPETGKSIGYTGKSGTLPVQIKNEIEAYSQKANIKNSALVSGTFEGFLDGSIDPTAFVKKLNDMGYKDDDILELLKILGKA